MPEPVPPPVLPIPRPSAILGQLGFISSLIALSAVALLVLVQPG